MCQTWQNLRKCTETKVNPLTQVCREFNLQPKQTQGSQSWPIHCFLLPVLCKISTNCPDRQAGQEIRSISAFISLLLNGNKNNYHILTRGAPENMTKLLDSFKCCSSLTQTMFNDFLSQTYRCGQTRPYKSFADSANGAWLLMGQLYFHW